MANENIESQNDKLQKLLETEGIKMPNFDVSNIENFKDYSNEELENMKGEIDSNDNLTEQDKFNIRKNIESIIKAKNNEERSKQVENNEEQARQVRQTIEEEGEKQKQKAEILSQMMWKMDSIIYLKQAKVGEIDENTEKIWKEKYTLDELKLCKELIEDDERRNKIGLSNISEDEKKWLIKNLEKVIKDSELGNTNEENEEQIKDEEKIEADIKQEAEQEAEQEREQEREQENIEDTPTETEEEKAYREQIDELNKTNKNLKEQVNIQTKIIERLLVAKKNNENTNEIKEELKKKGEEITKLKKERDKLIEDNKKMKDTYFGELPKYNGNIIPLKTKAIEFKFGQNENVGNQRVLSMPQLRLRKNIISRHRLNKTIKKLNEIGDNPKAGVNYVLTKADFFKGGAKIGTLCKKIGKYFTIRDIDSFDQKFNEQKKIFIDDIEAKMQGQMTEDDKTTLKAIKDRLDYYQKAYKRNFLTA